MTAREHAERAALAAALAETQPSAAVQNTAAVAQAHALAAIALTLTAETWSGGIAVQVVSAPSEERP